MFEDVGFKDLWNKRGEWVSRSARTPKKNQNFKIFRNFGTNSYRSYKFSLKFQSKFHRSSKISSDGFQMPSVLFTLWDTTNPRPFHSRWYLQPTEPPQGYHRGLGLTQLPRVCKEWACGSGSTQAIYIIRDIAIYIIRDIDIQWCWGELCLSGITQVVVDMWWRWPRETWNIVVRAKYTTSKWDTT